MAALSRAAIFVPTQLSTFVVSFSGTSEDNFVCSNFAATASLRKYLKSQRATE